MANNSWHGKEAMQYIEGLAKEAMEEAAGFLVGKVKDLVSQPYPPASDPYNPPHLRSGALQQSLGWKWNGNAIELGSSIEYAVHLELGTLRMLPRPFLLPTILDFMAEAQEIMKNANERRQRPGSGIRGVAG